MPKLKFNLIIFGAALSFILLASCSGAPASPGSTSPPAPPTRPVYTSEPASTMLPEAAKTIAPTPTRLAGAKASFTPAQPGPSTSTNTALPPEGSPKAHVLSVSVSGDPGAYTFTVEISSPDLGCEQYADWWEVIDEDGNLIYRRILAHSHVNEQPFSRSGGAVLVEADTVVWVRAHMNPGGYGGSALKGSVQDGFFPADLSADFASDLDRTPPIPDGCAF